MDYIHLRAALTGTPEWVARVDASHQGVIHALVVQHELTVSRYAKAKNGQEIIANAFADLLDAIARYKGFCHRYGVTEHIPSSAATAGAMV
jgi:hypothetical protein